MIDGRGDRARSGGASEPMRRHEKLCTGGEVRRWEHHLADVVESASDLIVSTDVAGRILTWNGAAERVSGYRREDVCGRLLSELHSERHQGVLRYEIARAARGRAFGTAELDLVTKSGRLAPVAWVGSPMRDDRELVVGVVAVGRDLTERRQFEAQLLRSQKLAALGVLAGGIAHEIRNPLTISASATQLLLENPDDPACRRECAEKILTGIQRASLIIDDVLRFARAEAGTTMEVVDLISAVRDAMALIADQAGIQHVRLQVELPEKPMRVNAVPSLLQQMFTNLLLNALHAMRGGGWLHVRVERAEEEGLVRIADTGHGIPSGDIEKIFDPFYTTRPVGRGTGLGLSLCYAIVTQHHGAIDVDSVEGTGTTFTVKLPLLCDVPRPGALPSS